MQMARVLSTFSLAALLGGSGGDRAAQPAPVSAQAVAQARLASASLPRFALFGWVSPPNDSTTDARIAELAGAGLDVALPAWADSGRFEVRFTTAGASDESVQDILVEGSFKDASGDREHLYDASCSRPIAS